MLSLADTAELLIKMKRFAAYTDTSELAVMAWHELLSPVIPDLETATEAMLEAFRNQRARDVDPHTILTYAADVVQARTDAAVDAQRALTAGPVGRRCATCGGAGSVGWAGVEEPCPAGCVDGVERVAGDA